MYQPAWNGGFLWDDAAHVTRPDLRSWAGLWRIWFDPGATQQYYPLSHSAFWLEHRLWGNAPAGYHLINIALHAVAAVLVALTLRAAIQLDPAYAEAHNNLGILLARAGRLEEAIAHFREALRLEPGSAEVRRNLDIALAGRRARP